MGKCPGIDFLFEKYIYKENELAYMIPVFFYIHIRYNLMTSEDNDIWR